MPLSLDKLNELLLQKGIVPSKFFAMDGTCFYIELFSLKTSEVFLMYIPSKYEFPLTPDDDNVYKIKYVDLENIDNVADNYAGGTDAEKAYGADNIQLTPDDGKLEEHLEGNYKHQITLDDVSDDDKADLRSIFRQVKRLKYCVQNIKFKLGIMYKNYICAVRRDDSLNCFVIKHYPRTELKKLFVIIDLESFYEKNEKLIDDVRTVRESIYKVLERNQGSHASTINKILASKKEIITIPQQAQIRKVEYEKLYLKLEKLLATMIVSEEKILEELHNLEIQGGETIQNDISKAHNKSRLDKELDKINSIKGDITRNMLILREKRENSILDLDKIMFDNTVMVDAILRNYGLLKSLC